MLVRVMALGILWMHCHAQSVSGCDDKLIIVQYYGRGARDNVAPWGSRGFGTAKYPRLVFGAVPATFIDGMRNILLYVTYTTRGEIMGLQSGRLAFNSHCMPGDRYFDAFLGQDVML